MILTFPLCAQIPAAPTRPSDTAPPPANWLRLEQVLESVDRNYPPLLIALQDRVIADADVTLAEGRFDLNLRAGFEGDYLGFYRNDAYRAGVDQATQFQGLTYFAGYQLGRGAYPGYEGKTQTDSLGQYTTGARLPLFRDRAIDSRRAELQKSLIGRRIADLGVDQQRLVIIQFATRRFYDWVTAGRRYRAAADVLRIAEERDSQLKEASQLGQIPAIDVTDNLRAILSRRATLVEAERLLQLTAIDLSLFYRDAAGDPILPQPAQLPPDFPAMNQLSEDRLTEDIELALRRRPEIQRFAAQREQVEVDRRLARNQMLPNIDAQLAFNRSAGDRLVQRGPSELIASLVFDLPYQRRQARGRELAAQARITQFDQRERFARDTVTAEVRDAYSALIAAYRRAEVLTQELDVTRQLEEAERVRFNLGDGNLFLVNLREQATFDTEIRQVGALNEYFRALALYEFSIAEALSSRP
ncbi:MAG: TolC family protein [Bryobacteraceae bacterium]|nr:TolC family protein [Bryobacteraceae bacterium]